MELPMLKEFQAQQAVWASVYKDLIICMLQGHGVAYEPEMIHIGVSDVIPRDVAIYMDGFSKAVAAAPSLGRRRGVLSEMLSVLNVPDIGKVLDEPEIGGQDGQEEKE